MSRFFIGRPIFSMVLSILLVIMGMVSLAGLPVAQFPEIAPPVIQVLATYVGADALTVEDSVATPIEEQVSGVDQMIYMYSTNANNGQMILNVNFEVESDPDTDQILVQMRYSQAQSQLPSAVEKYGVTVQKSMGSPLAVFSLVSPKGTYDALFLTNYAYININSPMTRVHGVGNVKIYGSSYAMRFWVKPDTLAERGITVPEIVQAIQQQNTVNPAGKIGGEPVPAGQQFTYTVRAQGRLRTVEEFGDVIVRADPDGAIVRMRDVARVELGAQSYQIFGRLNGAPAAILAIYQQPGANAIATVNTARALMEEAKKAFPEDLDYVVSLDTTLAVREGMREIVITLFEALVLVLAVVMLFLQNFRATLIPLVAVPVSLIGTFAFFPLIGFSVNTLSLFGLVLAIGLVVDDAIVVVEAVQHHIEQGLSARDAALKTMEQVSGPIVATTLILVAVFLPTAFLPGITGRLYQQFAVTIAVSVVISSFNALTLSPALAALLLRPRKEGRGPIARFFGAFNRGFSRATDGYVFGCEWLIRKAFISLLILGGVTLAGGLVGSRLAPSFLPSEDQGYLFLNVQLPEAASLQRTDEACRAVEEILAKTPGVQTYNTVMGYSLLTGVTATYSAFFFVQLEPWGERDPKGHTANEILHRLNSSLSRLPQAVAFAIPPPAIPGVGSAGGITFMLEDRSGRDVAYLAEQTEIFVKAANQRPEIARAISLFIPDVPQVFADVNRAKALKLGVDLGSIYQTLQAFMGGLFVNYFNRFGRVWQVYVEAEGEHRQDARDLGQFRVKNRDGEMVPLSTLVETRTVYGPEFTMRFNEYRAAQLLVVPAPGTSGGQAMAALEQVFEDTMPEGMGYDYSGMAYQAKVAAEGISPMAIFGLSLLLVFLILAAQYESWSLPFSVLLGIPIAVFGGLAALWLRAFPSDIYSQIGLVLLIGLSAKNAILIVEFAREEKAGGKSADDAALAAARLRLRPILMTAFAFILGVMPLALASGSGAISRQVLGTTVIGGMLAATVLAIFLIPVTFSIVERIVEWASSSGPGPAPAPPASPSADREFRP
ncbi:MAG: multidrug efflux RND transporter permease subunit [Myxococcales bacterium]|nr:multidrug efflux RND transporter permease subunit [Myxococcales bacterium]